MARQIEAPERISDMKTTPTAAATQKQPGTYQWFLEKYIEKAERRASHSPLAKQQLENQHVAILEFLQENDTAMPESLAGLLENISPDLHSAFEMELDALNMIWIMTSEQEERHE